MRSIIAGRACDDSAIDSSAIWKGSDETLATHMGKILECGALSAEPFAMDVMLSMVDEGEFILRAWQPCASALIEMPGSALTVRARGSICSVRTRVNAGPFSMQVQAAR